jgi:acetyl-CoA carboxylase carboxyl transferase subunit beta
MALFKGDEVPDSAGFGSRQKPAQDGLWTKCNNCGEIIYRKEVERNLKVCPKCGYHFRLSAEEWVFLVCDEGTFIEKDREMTSADVLNFKDRMKYRDRLRESEKETGISEAYVYGEAKIDGIPAIVGFFDFRFMGGSMGIVVGEKVTRSLEAGPGCRRAYIR